MTTTDEALERVVEQRDTLLRLVEQMKRAAGVENSADPVGDIERMRSEIAAYREFIRSEWERLRALESQ